MGGFGELPAETPGMRGISVLKRSLLGWSDMEFVRTLFYGLAGDAATEAREGVSNKGGCKMGTMRGLQVLVKGIGRPSGYLKGA
jgi:hypothetical protein